MQMKQVQCTSLNHVIYTHIYTHTTSKNPIQKRENRKYPRPRRRSLQNRRPTRNINKLQLSFPARAANKLLRISSRKNRLPKTTPNKNPLPPYPELIPVSENHHEMGESSPRTTGRRRRRQLSANATDRISFR